MQNITEQFNTRFEPFKALLIYRNEKKQDDDNYRTAESQIYVESYDIGKHGSPINAHPLTTKEMLALHDLFQVSIELKGGYLKSKGVLPSKVLYVNNGANGYAVWFTPPQNINLFFIEALNIPSGTAKIPAMIWKATEDKLSVYAIKGKSRPDSQTPLFHAPYLNIYHNGNVCMGSVKINIGRNIFLEDFISQWETYFFNSYFSHSINGNSSTKTDTVTLWRELMETQAEFPQNELIKNGLTLQHLIL